MVEKLGKTRHFIRGKTPKRQGAQRGAKGNANTIQKGHSRGTKGSAKRGPASGIAGPRRRPTPPAPTKLPPGQGAWPGGRLSRSREDPHCRTGTGGGAIIGRPLDRVETPLTSTADVSLGYGLEAADGTSLRTGSLKQRDSATFNVISTGFRFHLESAAAPATYGVSLTQIGNWDSTGASCAGGTVVLPR